MMVEEITTFMKLRRFVFCCQFCYLLTCLYEEKLMQAKSTSKVV